MTLRERISAAIAAWTSAAQRRVAPAMPWIFLALRRAAIPLLCWAIVAVFFFVVPQSREVLHGLSDPPLRFLSDLNAAADGQVNVVSLSCYLATAFILALAVWYAARLLTTVEAERATPPALAAGAGYTGLMHATTWLPRGLGVSVLIAPVGAFVFASFTPQLSDAKALSIVAVAIAGPLLSVVGALLAADAHPRARLASFAVSGMLIVWGAAALRMSAQTWSMWAWSWGACLLPALMLVFLVKRRTVLSLIRIGAGGASNDARRFGEVVVAIGSMFIGSMGALLLLAFASSTVVRAFGSAAAVLLFLAAAVLLLTTVQLLVRRVSGGVSGLTTACVVVVIFLVAEFGSESLGTEQVVADAAADSPSARAAQAPVQAMQPAASSAAPQRRRIFVNAYGGGIRAAIFTAEVLAQADDATCGAFGTQLAALSGVSGGSVGVATYLIAREDLVNRGGWPSDCRPASGAATSGSATHVLGDGVTRALVQDHLSPAIARGLTIDAPHLWGSPVRGQALLDSWQSAIVASLEVGRTPHAPKPSALATPLGRLNGGLQPPVRVYFNSTDADSGAIVWFSNRDDGIVGDNLRDSKPLAVPGMTVGQAVLHSARFPIVSPAGRFPPQGDIDTSRRLVDGGYADNSGATTLFNEFAAIQASAADGTGPAILLDIDGNQPDESLCTSSHDRPPLLTAVRALLQARAAHAALAVSQLTNAARGAEAVQARLDLESVYGIPAIADPRHSPQCEIVRRSQQAPLGWYVSFGAARTIAKSAQFEVEKLLSRLSSAPK